MDASLGLEKRLLSKLASGDEIADSSAEAESLGVAHQVLLGVVQSLWADEYVSMEAKSRSSYFPTKEGESILEKGSPEFLVYELVKKGEGLSMAEIEAVVGKDVAKLGTGAAMREKWVKKDGAKVVVAMDNITEDATKVLLASLENLSPEAEKILSRRKLINKKTTKFFTLKKGPSFSTERRKKVGDLTVEALKDGSWKTADFKAYNFSSMGRDAGGGFVQPLLKVRAEFRSILLGMGFEEMPTNKWVEASFWNFDALFQPQSHPARDAHDTFFVKEPRDALEWEPAYYERVKSTHENGGTCGSLGHQCVFEEKEARKNLLRTHTTAVSARMLYKLAQQKTFKPTKYFSIDRVFRNETMDSTHLCEFHQVEGLVADYDLSLGNLVSIIRTFFAKIGITQLRFKPAFNPYTEPSMEVFGYHPDLKKWTEIGTFISV